MKEIINRLLNHEELDSAETKQIMLNITKEMYPDAQIAALLTILQMRGVTVEELIGFREALMETRIPIDFSPYRPIDIVGTGGDGKNTFNISTCSCFVVAGAGYKVAKHGNYGASSVSGASNVLELHGVRFTNDQDKLLRSLEESNMAYLHAQLFNPAMKFVGPTRRSLQVPTVFNLLGPLINPSQPTYQLLGVANLSQMRLYTHVLNRLGMEFAVVTSLDGYDEISLTSGYKVMTNNNEQIYQANALGFMPSIREELFGGNSPQDAAKIFDDVLNDRATASQKQTVLVNAAFAIHVIEPHQSMETCVAIARESLESRKALQTFRKFVELNS
ncbi:MAG: anthranilate phosphoribosyltransferase [Bacteroidaceae bacterium]|nr:anthranilate phosphoribosyltransferase [Bacteroidaceae bacterium]MBR1542321.1 anthranilate phosphoribosyltransferase [Bacteroidaceae bacterium]